MDPEPWKELKSCKRGGKRRKAPKRLRATKAKVGDTVYLMPGNVPMPPIYHTHKRLATPGQLYSELPKVLNQQSYGIAPMAYRPMTQHEFVAAGDMMYGRERNFYDDIVINVNPRNIEPNRVPSKRIIPSSNKNAMPLIEAPIVSSLPFLGDTPAIHLTADRTPSMRAAPSQPSSAAFVGVHYAIPSAAFMEQYASQMEQQAALQSIAEARMPARPRAAAKPKLWSGIQSHIAGAKEKFATKAELEAEGYKSYNEAVKAFYQEAKNTFPSMKELEENDFQDYDEAVEFMMANMKRGGIRRRGRGGY